MEKTNDFSGTWHLKYWFPNPNNDDQEDISEYDATISRHEDHFTLQSLTTEDESYIFARLYIEDDIVSGTWQENTSPHKEYKGAIYNGSFKLLLNPEKTAMVGKHVGDGFRKGAKHIYCGRFEIVRVKP